MLDTSSVRRHLAQGRENGAAAVQGAADGSLLTLGTRWSFVRLVGESDGPTAVIVHDHSSEVSVVGVYHHPPRSEVGRASLVTVDKGQLIEGRTYIWQVVRRDGAGLTEAFPCAAVLLGVTADPCLLRFQKIRELLRRLLHTEAIAGRVVPYRQTRRARLTAHPGELVGPHWGWVSRCFARSASHESEAGQPDQQHGSNAAVETALPTG